MAAGNRLTARAGAEALARGGTAIDAVCAAAFAAAVAESPLTGPGAGGFLLHRAPDGATFLLDFFVAVPGLGPGGRALDPGELVSFTVPFGGADQVFHIGPASVAVPGLIPGLGEAHRRAGRLPLPDLVEPAVRLAREGVELGPQAAYLHEILGEMLVATPAAAAVYAPGGRLLGEGERVVLPDLAETLAHIGRAGTGTMRDGPLARAVVEHLADSGGLVTADDLAGYRVVERQPLELAYRDVTVLTNPPPSSGGALIAAALSRMGAEPPAPDELGHFRAVARAGIAANALRDEAFAADLREEDCMERLWARLAEPDAGARPPAPPPSRKPTGGTTHISAVDAEGGMASLSSSNGSGSGVVVPGTGILLNNMLGEEDLNPGGFGDAARGPADDLDDGADPDPARRRAGAGPGLGGLEPAAIRHPSDDGQRDRRRDDLRGRRRPAPRPPRGRRDRRRGWRPRGRRGGAGRRRPSAAPLGRREPLLRRRQRRRPGPRRPRGGGRLPPRRRGGRRDPRRPGDRPVTHRQVETESGTYELDPQPVRTSLTDGPPMLWGFQVRILQNGEEIAIKTCFVGRVSVQFRDEAALDGPIEGLLPVLHELAFEKVEERLRAGEPGDEILFA